VACTLALAAVLAAGPTQARADEGSMHTVLVRDITSIEGVRDNLLVGYGLVVGLNRTGDTQQTYFTVQTLTNALQKMGVLISPAQVEVRNVAAVFVTASLPPFARPGEKLDVTVASVGDAKSLEGGVLLMSALHGPDGKIYAEAQGPLVFGGYYVGTGFNVREVNHTTTGIIPNGGIVERDTAVDVRDFKTVSLLLRNPDFATAADMSNAINREFSRPIATVIDSRRVDVNVAAAGVASVPDLIAQIQSVALLVHTPAKIIINERTGTIVLGGDVKLSPVSVIHGNLSIQVTTTLVPSIAQNGNGTSTTTLVPQTNLNVNDGPAQTMRLDDGANVEELVNGLHALGTTASDVVAILQSIKAEGGLQADLEVQ
jgi:flagellar P-ring protein FlgI